MGLQSRSRSRQALLALLFGLLVALPGLAGCGRAALAQSQLAPARQAQPAIATPRTPAQPPAASRGPTDTLAALAPARLVIPKMGLNAPILSLGPDPSGAMQAPRIGGPQNPIWSQVYWWDVGAMPGQRGNAVIAGHVNRPDGSASTFTHLNLLNPGDTLQIVTVGGTVLTFVVTAKNTPLIYIHGGNDPTVERIFGPATAPQLNLMTCWGEWDGTDYNRRLVVYSTLVGTSPFPVAPSSGVPVQANG